MRLYHEQTPTCSSSLGGGQGQLSRCLDVPGPASLALHTSPSMLRRYWDGVRGNLCSDCCMFFSRMHRARYRPLQTTSKSSTVTCRRAVAEHKPTIGT